MAKVIRYKIVDAEINYGTEENPNVEQIIGERAMTCPTEEAFNIMLPIAEKEAVPGTIEVSGEFEPDEPDVETTDDVLNALLGVSV